jgi:cytochrome P450
VAAYQTKAFLFTGHDPTSISLRWDFYELSRNPPASKAIRSELDDIFGRIAIRPLCKRSCSMMTRMPWAYDIRVGVEL